MRSRAIETFSRCANFPGSMPGAARAFHAAAAVLTAPALAALCAAAGTPENSKRNASERGRDLVMGTNSGRAPLPYRAVIELTTGSRFTRGQAVTSRPAPPVFLKPTTRETELG